MDSNNNYKSNVDGFFDMLSSLIDVRYYDLISATAEKSGDPTFIKMVEWKKDLNAKSYESVSLVYIKRGA